MIPKKLEINGEVWTVRLKHLHRKGLAGLCVHKKNEIHLEKQLPDAEMQETFLHEVMHACIPELVNSQVEERIVEALSPRLLAALQGIGWVK